VPPPTKMSHAVKARNGPAEARSPDQQQSCQAEQT
jgi:hypothetical protein